LHQHKCLRARAGALAARPMDKAPHWRHSADPLTEQAKPTIQAVREDLARVPLARRIVTIVFVVFAIFVARSSWDLRVVDKTIPGVTHLPVASMTRGSRKTAASLSM